MIKLSFFIEPMGAVRMTQKSKYASPAARRYLDFKKYLGLSAKQQLKEHELSEGALDVSILFTMPIPGSWSKKKQREAVGQYHVKKPDSDNLIKSVFDSLNKIVWNDDNQVAKVSAVKVYGEEPGIDVTIKAL